MNGKKNILHTFGMYCLHFLLSYFLIYVKEPHYRRSLNDFTDVDRLKGVAADSESSLSFIRLGEIGIRSKVSKYIVV